MVRRCLVVGVLAGLACLWPDAPASGQAAKKPGGAKVATLAAEAKTLADELKAARESVRRIPDKVLRERLELSLLRAESAAGTIRRGLDELAAATPAAKEPMSPADFQRLLAAVKAANFDDKKGDLIAGVRDVRLSCEQLKAVLETFSFDDRRVKAGLHLYPMLTDPGNIFTLQGVFSFSSSWDSFREAVGKGKK